MVRFLAGLDPNTAAIVKLQHYVEIEDMVHMAMKCLGRGKIASQCPNCNTMLLRDDEEVESEQEEDEIEDDAIQEQEELEHAVEGEALIVKRSLSMQPIEGDEQHENIFHTRCHIGGKVCFVIIDGGSCTNVASTLMVEKLGLATTKHPHLHKLQWLNDGGELKVSKQVLIAFSIRKYKDEEFEDIFPEEIPSEMPPICGIEHQIDFVPGAIILNRPAYRSNPEETKELQRQVSKLMAKGYVRESLSPCAVPVLLVPKKDGSWRMCVDC
ncbi:hypothetical protein V6N13_061131 [Hibiscus sabdariffa]